VLGDCPIATGDLVAGDADGVVVVPSARIAEIIEALDQVAAREAELHARIESGTFETLLSEAVRRSIRYVD
jgi:regulator of RNase E activity RraA